MTQIEKIMKLIAEHIDASDFCDPIEESAIIEAERLLGVLFPPSYRTFVKNYGAGDIMGLEIYGIIKNPLDDKPLVPNGIWLTMKLRKEASLPKSYIVIGATGYGPYYAIDTGMIDSDKENPVVIWSSDAKIETVKTSFGEFLYDSLTQQLE